MTTEAERLADKLNSLCVAEFAWPTLNDAATTLRKQAAEIERLKSEAELFAKHTGLTLAAKDTLLRQALDAMFGIRDFTYKQLVAKAIDAIKQHLGDV